LRVLVSADGHHEGSFPHHLGIGHGIDIQTCIDEDMDSLRIPSLFSNNVQNVLSSGLFGQSLLRICSAFYQRVQYRCVRLEHGRPQQGGETVR